MERRSDDTGVVMPKCATCAHYLGFGRCLAFDRIPSEILRNITTHTQKRPQQIGDYVYRYAKAKPRITVIEQ